MSAMMPAAALAWPLLVGALLLLIARRGIQWQRVLGIIGASGGLLIALGLLLQANDNQIAVTLMGNWPARVGIVLVVDRLAAMLLTLTAVIGLTAAIHACAGADRGTQHFHALLQFQLMGLNGAFLTGDLFNLFVWFEVLLIASYGLLLHRAGALRLRAGVVYVVFNLAGSALFLVALALIYGIAGTLNMAELGSQMATLTSEQQPLMAAAGALLLVVFCIKAALLPLYFWLPGSYGVAAGAVAAMFTILTKVGLYCTLRVYTVVFGGGSGAIADLIWPLLLPFSMLTLTLAAVGALAARDLGRLTAFLVVASAGTTMLAFALNRPETIAAGLSYLLQSTLATAMLFLLTDAIRRYRERGDQLNGGAMLRHAGPIAILLFLALIALGGLPPLPGFLTKALLITATIGHPHQGLAIGVLLLSSLLMLLALVRAFTQIAWNRGEQRPEAGPADAGVTRMLAAPSLMMVLLVLLSVYAGPVQNYAQATAQQLQQTAEMRALPGRQAPLPRPEIVP